MNENARKWVQALRSGDYKRGTTALHRHDRFCCLGVACDLYQREVAALTVTSVNDGIVCYDGHRYALPKSVQNWLGLRDGGGSYSRSTLMTRNDSGASFQKLADLIESEPPDLFVEGES